jgi:hypothetical protein
VRILKENQRVAVFRLGRFSHISGPGLVFAVPFIDRVAVVDLDETIPGWRECAPEELDRMVEFLVKQYPEIPADLSLQEIREKMQESKGPSRWQ